MPTIASLPRSEREVEVVVEAETDSLRSCRIFVRLRTWAKTVKHFRFPSPETVRRGLFEKLTPGYDL